MAAKKAEAKKEARRDVSIPYPAGMALWPHAHDPAHAHDAVSIPYPAGMALWPTPTSGGAGGGSDVSIPYPAGMALWLPTIQPTAKAPPSLNPLSSGDGFVAVQASAQEQRDAFRLNPLSSGDGFVAKWNPPMPVTKITEVSIPYPAGMALWLRGAWAQTSKTFLSLNPLSSGDGFVALDRAFIGDMRGTVSIPYPAGMALWLGYSDHQAGCICVSIPYPAGMALWPATSTATPKPTALSQSPIQRGWLCGKEAVA